MTDFQSGSSNEQLNQSGGMGPEKSPQTPTGEAETAAYPDNVFVGIENRVDMYPELDTKNEEVAQGLLEKFPNALRKIELPDGSIAAVLAIEDILPAIHARDVDIKDQAMLMKQLKDQNHYSESPVNYIFSKDGITYFHKKKNTLEDTPDSFFIQAVEATRDPSLEWTIYDNGCLMRTTDRDRKVQFSDPETGQSFSGVVMNIPTGLLVESNLHQSMDKNYWSDLIRTVEQHKKSRTITEPREVLDQI